MSTDYTSPYNRRNNVNPLHNYADVTNSQDALGQLLPQTLILQDLVALYHLFEGTGTTANDSAPVASPNNGSINGVVNTDWKWLQGPVTKVLEFLGAAGYVNCTNASDVTKGGTNSAFSVGCWFSPFAFGSDQNYLVARDGQYVLQQIGTSGAVRFGVHIGGGWVYLQSDSWVCPLNCRCFVLGVYDGANMYLYISNPIAINQLLIYSQAQTGTLDASASSVIIGAKTSSFGGLNGAVSECMIWARALGGQEALELFFRPMFRVVKKGAATPQYWYLTVTNSTGGSTTPTGVINVPSGQSQTVNASPLPGWSLVGFYLDGTLVSTNSSYTVAAQTTGSTHALVVQFSQLMQFPPAYSGIFQIPQTLGFVSPALTETATATKGATASESLADTPAVSKGGTASESMSETPAVNLPTASSFGDATAEATADAQASGYIRICKFAAAANGKSFKLRLYGSGSSATVYPVIYSDNAGAPNALLGYGAGVAPPASAGWFDLYLEGVTITNGSSYWIGVLILSNTFTMYYATGGANQSAVCSCSSAPPPQAFGAPTYAARKYSFQCFTC